MIRKIKFKNKHSINTIAITNDGSMLAVGQTSDGKGNYCLTIFNSDATKILYQSVTTRTTIKACAFSRDNKYLVYATGSILNLLNIHTREIVSNRILNAEVNLLQCAPEDDSFLLSGQYLELWDLAKFSPAWRFSGYVRDNQRIQKVTPEILGGLYELSDFDNGEYSSYCHAAATFTDDGSKILVTGIDTPYIHQLDARTGKLLNIFAGGVLQAASLKCTGNRLGLQSWRPTGNFLWEYPGMKRLLADQFGKGWNCVFAIHPHKPYIAIGWRVINILSMEDGKNLRYIDTVTSVSTLDFTPDGAMLIVGDNNSNMLVIDFEMAIDPRLEQIRLNGEIGYIDPSGKVTLYNPGASSVKKGFHEGLAAVEKSSKYGYVNTDYVTVIPFEFDSAGDFQGGTAQVLKDDQWIQIDRDGK